jgi:uncharacterized protein (TIGR02246 family)
LDTLSILNRRGGIDMPARTPEDLDRLFADAFNAGDLDALASLYEPNATLIPEPGKSAAGVTAIRQALAAFSPGKATIAMNSRLLAQAGDLALVTSKWSLATSDADGQRVELKGDSIEVCRRQADDTWLFVMDTPWGLA